MIDITLSVGTSKLKQFETKSPLAALAELVWNSLDADAHLVNVEIVRTQSEAISRIIVTDDGIGITPDQARISFGEYGDTWKSLKKVTPGEQRVLHGIKGEGRLYAFSLGHGVEWSSVAIANGRPTRIRILGDASRPTRWQITDPEPLDAETPTGTVVTIDVPQGKVLRSLEDDEEVSADLLARIAFYLRSYRVSVTYEGRRLDFIENVEHEEDIVVSLPESYARASAVLSIIEWRNRTEPQAMLICDANGLAFSEYGRPYKDALISFTPYLRSDLFRTSAEQDIHALIAQHGAVIDLAEELLDQYLRERHDILSFEVVSKLKSEGLYPYSEEADASPTRALVQQTFDLVVTAARRALPKPRAARELSVKLIQSSLEEDPSSLSKILTSVLRLSADEHEHLATLLENAELSKVISASKTVTDRLNFVAGLRKILSEPTTRREFREVDQLHPMISKNLWLFGEEWTLSVPEMGLTAVLAAHLATLGDDTVLETKMEPVKRADGTSGRVDVVLFRGIGDERRNERIVVELKRPTVKVGKKELDQITSYARAIVEDPQFKGVACTWTFLLVSYEIHSEIDRDINQKDKPRGLADDQPEYEVWVKSWGDIFDEVERKLSFFQRALDYEATEERVIHYLRESYAKYIPDSLA